jgi:hypothetical protein
MDTALIDGTYIEANVHHPTDWILLGDVARTLLLGLDQIRKRGILNPMPWASVEFRSRFNKLSIEIIHTRRRKDAQNARKNVLRRKKRLLNSVGEHARRHVLLLDKGWKEAGFHPGEYRQLKGRMEKMLELLPKMNHQAHERMIGGRKVANSAKIFSAYDADVQVLVRVKFGKEVEYGNHCLLAENEAGYIVDWHLYRGRPPGEPEQLRESIRRQWKLNLDDDLQTVVSDRGLNSKQNTRFLKRNGIADVTCPRNHEMLKQRLEDTEFKRLQKRRGSTEARIAILKNGRLCGPIRAKGYNNRAITLGWAILSHNLWMLSRQLQTGALCRERLA